MWHALSPPRRRPAGAKHATMQREARACVMDEQVRYKDVL
jgi:hypothetical protein